MKKTLDMDVAEFREWLADCGEWGANALATLDTEPLHRRNHSQLFSDLDENPRPRKELLDFLFRNVLNDGFHATSGGFMAYVPGGGIPTAAFADFLAALSNRYVGSSGASPMAARMESDCIRWLMEWVGFPKGAWGSLLSGGTLATLCAVVSARERLPFESWGKAVIYSTEETHHCLKKAFKIAGLGSAIFRSVESDERLRMVPERLEYWMAKDRADGLVPFWVNANAGTTNTGAIDPIQRLGEIARAHRVWFHVDAAYGGFFILTARGRQLLQGISLADSIVLDPHKGLFLPYGCGGVLVREGSLLKQAFSHRGSYLADLDQGLSSPDDYSPELTRHFRSLRLWLTLQSRGLGAFRAALDEKLDLAEEAYLRLLRIEDIELFEKPQLSCLALRSRRGDAVSQRLLGKVNEGKKVFLSSTRFRDSYWIRICILSFRTHRAEMDRAVEAIREAARAV